MTKRKKAAPIAERYLLLASRFTGIHDHRDMKPADLAADPIALSEFQALVGIAKAMKAAVAAQPPGAVWSSRAGDNSRPAGIEAADIARRLAPVVTGTAAAKGYHVELMRRYLADSAAVLTRSDDNELTCLFPESDGKHLTGHALLNPPEQTGGERPDLSRGPEPRPTFQPRPGPKPDLRGKPRLKH